MNNWISTKQTRKTKSNERKIFKHVLLVDTYVIYIRYPVTECDFLSTKTESVLIIRIFDLQLLQNKQCNLSYTSSITTPIMQTTIPY